VSSIGEKTSRPRSQPYSGRITRSPGRVEISNMSDCRIASSSTTVSILPVGSSTRPTGPSSFPGT
jgi:hypothetical protein